MDSSQLIQLVFLAPCVENTFFVLSCPLCKDETIVYVRSTQNLYCVPWLYFVYLYKLLRCFDHHIFIAGLDRGGGQACRHPEHKIHPRTLRVLEFQGVAAGLCLLKFCTTCFAGLILVVALKCRAMLPIISSGLHCLFKVFCLFMQISASIFFHFYKKTDRILRLLCIYKS